MNDYRKATIRVGRAHQCSLPQLVKSDERRIENKEYRRYCGILLDEECDIPEDERELRISMEGWIPAYAEKHSWDWNTFAKLSRKRKRTHRKLSGPRPCYTEWEEDTMYDRFENEEDFEDDQPKLVRYSREELTSADSGDEGDAKDDENDDDNESEDGLPPKGPPPEPKPFHFYIPDQPRGLCTSSTIVQYSTLAGIDDAVQSPILINETSRRRKPQIKDSLKPSPSATNKKKKTVPRGKSKSEDDTDSAFSSADARSSTSRSRSNSPKPGKRYKRKKYDSDDEPYDPSVPLDAPRKRRNVRQSTRQNTKNSDELAKRRGFKPQSQSSNPRNQSNIVRSQILNQPSRSGVPRMERPKQARKPPTVDLTGSLSPPVQNRIQKHDSHGSQSSRSSSSRQNGYRSYRSNHNQPHQLNYSRNMNQHASPQSRMYRAMSQRQRMANVSSSVTLNSRSAAAIASRIQPRDSLPTAVMASVKPPPGPGASSSSVPENQRKNGMTQPNLGKRVEKGGQKIEFYRNAVKDRRSTEFTKNVVRQRQAQARSRRHVVTLND